MNSKICCITTLLICFFSIHISRAQTGTYSVGAYTDFQVEISEYYYGVLGRYDLNAYSSFQARLGISNVDIKSIEFGYLYNFLDNDQKRFNVFASAGLAYDMYRKKSWILDGGDVVVGKQTIKSNFLVLKPQIGISYRIPVLNTTASAGYQIAYYLRDQEVSLDYLSISLRYHL